MNNVEKLRVMLQHWIDHNKGHVEEFVKWRELMREEGQDGLADQIDGAIKGMDDVNHRLLHALDEAGGPPEGGGHHHHHH